MERLGARSSNCNDSPAGTAFEKVKRDVILICSYVGKMSRKAIAKSGRYVVIACEGHS